MDEERERVLTLDAEVENLVAVNALIEELLEPMGCSMKAQLQLEVAVEEIFVNIASYAYASEKGSVTIRGNVSHDPPGVMLSFEDSGVAYNPLKKEDPDINAPLEERKIGGLGVFLVKKNVDDVQYEHRDGKNVLTIRKNLS